MFQSPSVISGLDGKAHIRSARPRRKPAGDQTGWRVSSPLLLRLIGRYNRSKPSDLAISFAFGNRDRVRILGNVKPDECLFFIALITILQNREQLMPAPPSGFRPRSTQVQAAIQKTCGLTLHLIALPFTPEPPKAMLGRLCGLLVLVSLIPRCVITPNPNFQTTGGLIDQLSRARNIFG